MPRLPGFLFGMLLCSYLLPLPDAAAQEPAPVFSETFDGITSPDIPRGWRLSGSGWATSGLAPSGGSGANNLIHEGMEAGAITTPSIDLSSLNAGTLSYTARRTDSYDQDRLVLTASTDGGLTFPITLLPAGTALPVAFSTYTEISLRLPDEVLGQASVILRFEASGEEGGGGGSANIRLDDVEITGTAGGLIVSPPSLTFAADVGTTQDRVVTIQNSFMHFVQLAAPEIAGAAYSVASEPVITLAPGAVQTYTVTFSPVARDAYSGALTIRHDQGEIIVPLLGSVVENAFGFSVTSSTTVEGGGISIPLSLDYKNATPLQGLEFTAEWDASALTLAAVDPGRDIADANQWHLTYEANGSTVHVVLLGAGATGLAAATYDSLLILQFSGDVPEGVDEFPVHVTLSNLTGALAVPTGDDAVLTASRDTHTLTLLRRKAFFQASAKSVDLGMVEVGQTGTATISVQNTAGTGDLRISGATSTSPVFSVSPPTSVIAPGAAQAFTVSFSPTNTDFGRLTANLIFTHDGDGGKDTVDVSGLGEGGRGDGYKDGMVEAMDLVYLLDFAVGRVKPDERQRFSSDVFPYPRGDGNVDVHDATVLSQAIVNGRWPDGIDLPLEISLADPGGGKDTKPAPVRVGIDASSAGSDASLVVQNEMPLLALQLVFAPYANGTISTETIPGVSLLGEQHEPEGTARLLLYASGGHYLPPGEYSLATLRQAGGPGQGKMLYATAIDTSRTRLPVSFDAALRTGSEGPPALPDDLSLGATYPQPFVVQAGRLLNIPIELPQPARVRLVVYDLMGREVAVLFNANHEPGRFLVRWDGRSTTGASLPGGLYLLRLDDGHHARTRKIVVVH